MRYVFAVVLVARVLNAARGKGDPVVEGDVFTVYVEAKNKQPYRATVDLSALKVGERV